MIDKLMLLGFGIIAIPILYVFISLLLFEITGKDIETTPFIEKALYRLIIWGFCVILLSVILMFIL
jgi:hypothetical protein